MMRPRYVLIIEPLPGVDAVRVLRWVLKRLLRDHGLRCVSVSEANPERSEGSFCNGNSS